MNKEDKSTQKKFATKDIILIIVAILAVLGLVLFLVFVQKKQDSERAKVGLESELQAETQQQRKKAAEAQDSIVIVKVGTDKKIELYNPSNVSVSLKEFFLEVNGVKKECFTEQDTIEKGGSFVIEKNDQLQLDGSDVVALVRGEGIIVDRLLVSNVAQKNAPLFSLPSGFYSEQITVEITAGENEVVYYTLDGTKPTPESEKYTEALVFRNASGNANVYSAIKGTSIYANYVASSNVDKGVILRAISVDEAGVESQIETATYFIDMGYKSMYNKLPVVSIISSPEHFFDYFDGIYVNGQDYEDALARDNVRYNSANYYRGNQIGAYIQYFEAEDKALTFQGNVLLSIWKDGNIDRGQKSFKFAQDGAVISKGSSLSNFMKNNMILSGGEADYTFKIRQNAFGELLKDAECSVLEYEPCIVFLDGEFWGLYLMQSECNAKYIADKFQVSQSEVQIAHEGSGSFNELYQWVTTTDMNVDGNYNKVKEQMDIQSYLDYYCANIYLGNSEFSTVSSYAWKTSKAGEGYADGKWRFIADDFVQTADLAAVNSYSINTFLRENVYTDVFLRSLMRNNEFSTQFLATLQRMQEEYFKQEKVEEIFGMVEASYKRAVISSSERYGGRITEEGYGNEVTKIYEFLENRPTYIFVHAEKFIEETVGWNIGTVDDGALDDSNE